MVYSFEEKLVTNTRKVSLKPEKPNRHLVKIMSIPGLACATIVVGDV
jgi:hypothetical protein